jgi:hypothetical protein
MTAMVPVASRTVPQETVGQAGAGSYGPGSYGPGSYGPGSYGPGAAPDPAAGGGAARRASLVERGYVHARFGGVPVLVGPELAAQLRADRQKQP